MIDFATVKESVIPEGVVASVSCAGKILWQKVALPPEYAAVEYLESTGTQYIDTGIKLTSAHSVELDYQLTASPQYRTGLFGGLFSGSIRYGSLLSPSNAALEHGYGLSNSYWQQGMPDLERHVLRQEKNKIYVNGVLVYTFGAATFSTTVSAKLGTFDYTNYKPAQARYFRSRWWDNGALVRDFLPCYRKSDGKPGMYDVVSKAFFTNAGTGEFVCEKPAYKRELAYLESTGSQWIDTGITMHTATDEVDVVFQSVGTTVYKWFLGEHDNSARFGLGSGDGTNKRNVAYGATTYKVTDKQMYDSAHRFIAAKNGVFLDDVKVANFSSFSSTSTVYLFNLNLNGGTYMGSAKIWTYKHKRNGTLVRDFIPVMDCNDRPCMYDKVSGEFFYNQGSGEFLYG